MSANVTSLKTYGFRTAVWLCTGALGAGGLVSIASLTSASASPPTAVYAVVGQLTGCEAPSGMTVIRDTNGDDTVYAACTAGSSIAFISDDSTSGEVDDTISLWSGSQPTFLASIPLVNGLTSDDTIYALDAGQKTVTAAPPGATTSDDSISIDDTITSFTVSADDTVYLVFDDTTALDVDDSIGIINPGFGGLNDSFAVPLRAYGIVTLDDTMFITGFSSSIGSGGLGAINTTSNSLDDSTAIPSNPFFFSQMVVDDTALSIQVANAEIRRFNPQTLSLENTVAVSLNDDSGLGMGGAPSGLLALTSPDQVQIFDQALVNQGVVTIAGNSVNIKYHQAVTRSGLVYVGDFSNNLIFRIGKITPTLAASSGDAGTTVTLMINPDAPDVTVDDSTVVQVNFGSSIASVTPSGRNTFDVTVPSGSGTQAVTVTLNGVATPVSLGNWTYPAGPTPTFPPSAVLNVLATAGDASATLTWAAPTSSGSFPVSQYQAVANPGARGCLVAAPSLTCEVTGLANGTTYTFTVRALNGSGWGPFSTASNAVTPEGSPPVEQSILISGTRGEVRGRPGVIVTGAAEGFDMGAILKPWFRFPGRTSYSEGTARILVSTDGEFTWSRRTGKLIYISIRSEDGSVRSNRVIVPAR